MSDYWRDDHDALGGMGSIAGVAFHIEGDDLELGRRKAVQRYPGTSFVRGQDVGAGERAHTINGYLKGRSYHLVRQKLIDVFEDAADKVLVHPSYGTFTVTIEGKLKIGQKLNQQGKCTLSFRCIEVPPTTSSSSTTPDFADLSALGAAVLRSTATPAMAAQLTRLTSAAPNAALMSSVSSLQTGLASAYAAVQSGISAAEGLAAQIDSLASDVASAISSPLTIMTRIGSVVSSLMAAPMRVADAGRAVIETLSDGQRVASMLGIAEFLRSSDGPSLAPLTERALSDVPSEDATESEAAFRAERAVTAIVRLEVVATMVEQLARRLPESSAQAREAQAEILAAIAGVGGSDPDALLFAVSDEVREKLLNVHATATRFLSEASINLPELRTYTVPSETDAFDLAMELYGDASRWEEIVARNGIQCPALIPAGTVIEYIEAA